MKCDAIVFEQAGQVGFDRFELGPCGDEEIVAETIYSFVSPGTELRVLSGAEPAKDSFPLVPGYSWVGRVIEIGSNVKGWREGDLVSGRNPLPLRGIKQLWGGQASHHRCPVAGYDRVVKLPHAARAWDYVPLEVAGISWRGVTSAFPAPGETAVVIGQGLIGAFNALWLLTLGSRVIVLDLREERLERARGWGVAAALNASAPDIREQILALCEAGIDIVMESSGTVPGAELAYSLTREPVYRTQDLSYPFGALGGMANVWPRLVFQATHTKTIECLACGPTTPEGVLVLKPRDRTVGDRLAAMEKIRSGVLKMADIVDEPTPVNEARASYTALRDRPDRVSAVAFQWPLAQ